MVRRVLTVRRALLVALSTIMAANLAALTAAPMLRSDAETRRPGVSQAAVLSQPATGEPVPTTNPIQITVAHTVADVGEAIDTWFPRHGVNPVHGRCVGNKESGLAAEPRWNGLYLGVFQHDIDYWPGRVIEYNRQNDLKTPNADWKDPTTQALVSAWMVARDGWGPWPNTARECGLLRARRR